MDFLQSKHRKQNYRPKVSLAEKWICGFILFLLAVIAFGVYLEGRCYERGLFSLDTSALDTTRLKVEGARQRLNAGYGEAPTSETAQTGTSSGRVSLFHIHRISHFNTVYWKLTNQLTSPKVRL